MHYKKIRNLVLKYFVLPVAIIQSLLFIAAFSEASFLKTDQYAAILISDHFITSYDYWISPGAFLGAYPYWTHYFAKRNMKTKWFFRATSKDLEKVIHDENAQSIVVIGHGNVDAWRATDIAVTDIEVSEMMKGGKKKNGEWFQLTCGGPQNLLPRLGELVMKPENVYAYGRTVSSFPFIWDVFSSFQYIKKQKQ